MSRLQRVMKSIGLDDVPLDVDGGLGSMMFLGNLGEEFIDYLVLELGLDDQLELFRIINDSSNQLKQYYDEVESRKEHCKQIGIWTESEPNDNEKQELPIYHGDNYLNIYLVLSQEHLVPENLNLYESLILHEDIVVNKIKESCYSMLGLLDKQKYHGFIESMKTFLKYANFTQFVIEVYDEIEKTYNLANGDKK